MKTIAPGIEQWSWFSDEKQLDFNGLLLTLKGQRLLVDPPPLSAEDCAALHNGPPIQSVVLTNRDHVREAERCRRDFKALIYAPAADAPLMDITPDKTYQHGDLLPGGLRVIHLPDMKSPGESALLLDEQACLILGDALIGKPPGQLNLLPAEKFADVRKAKESLQRLLTYSFERVLVGDGTSIVAGGQAAVRRAIQS